MALSDEVLLGITAALEQLKKLDKALAKSLNAEVALDTKLAADRIKALRALATETLGKKIDITLSTVTARAELGKLETKVQAFRRMAEKSIDFGLNRRSLDASARALGRLEVATEEYRRTAVGAARSVRLLTSGLRNQAVQAGILAGELREVAGSIAAINVAASKVRKPSIGRDATGDTLGPITGQRIDAIKTVEAAEVEAQATTRRAMAETAAAAKRLAAEQIAAAKKVVAEAERDAARAAAAARQGRAPSGALLGPITNGRALALQEQERAAKTAAVAEKKLADEAARAERNATAGLRALRSESAGLNQQLIATGRSMSILFTLPVIVAAAFAAFNEFKFQETIQRTKVLTDAFTKFDDTGKKVNLTAAETTTRMAGLRDVFNSIAAKTGQTPNDIAEGFYFVASAGGAAATRLSILRVAAQGAAVGLGSVEVVADALTSVLNAYGEAEITAAQAGDILVKAVNDAKVEASALAPQLGRVLPIAAELGINFGQVAEALALLTQNGNDAAVASTQLRGILQTLIRPTSQKAADILASVGLSVAQLRDQVSKPTSTALIDTLIKLRNTLPIEQFSQLFRRVDALNGALTLTNNPDAIKGFREIAEAAKNTSGDLEEFERFAANNRALQIRQAFAQLLAQLQPLGQKVLPLVAAGIGIVVGAIDKLGDILKTPGLKQLAIVFGAALVLAGPLIFSVGKLRQALSALIKVQTVLGVSGGFGRFLKGEAVADIAAGADVATRRVGLLGRAFGALPGVIGVGAAAGLAFFSGSALASKDLQTKLLGIVGTLGAVGIAYKSAAAASKALGAAAGLAGGIGAVVGLLVAGIAAFSAYKEATEKSRKALVEFQSSLEGLTANEAVKQFPAALAKSLEGITADDRVTKIEIPELKKALDDLGLSYEDLGQKLLNIVLANPDDLEAQKLALRGLAEEISSPIGANSGDTLANSLQSINDALAGGRLGRAFATLADGSLLSKTAAEELKSFGVASDEVSESLITLADKGLVEFRNGILQIPVGKLDEAKRALGDAFGPDTAALLDAQAEAFRRARQAALDTTGEFTTATNDVGAFKTVMEDGVETDVFVSNVDDAVQSLDLLTKAVDTAVKAVFGIRDATTVSQLADVLSQAAEKRAKDLIDLKKPTDESFINFKVGLSGPSGTDARQYIREQIDGIDKEIAPFLSGPNANIPIALQIREQQVQTLAAQLGITVKQLNDFLASDRGGTTTAQIGVELDKNSTQQAIDELANLKALIDSSPLTQEVKVQIGQDTTGNLFGSELLGKGLSNGKVVVDFVVNAEASGTSLDQLQAIFAAAPQDTVRNVVINAIDQGVSIDKITKFLAAVPSTVRLGLKVEPPEFVGVGTDISDLEKQRFLFDAEQEKQLTINAAVEGADAADIAGLATDITDKAQNGFDAGGGVTIPTALAPIDTSSVDAARDAALDATGEFIIATDAAGSFVTTLDDSGDSFTTFRADVDKTTTTISGLTAALDAAVQAVFGIRDQTTLSTASDSLAQLADKRAEDLAAATEKTTKAQAQADVASAQQQAADARAAKAAGDSEQSAAVEAARIAKDAADAEADAARAAANASSDTTVKTPRELAAAAAVAAADLALQEAQAANEATDAAARESAANAAVAAADEAVRAAQVKATAAEAGGVNFKVGLEGPDATDARQFIRDQIDQIDAIIAPFLSGPDADLPVGLKMRDDAIADLAEQTGLTVDQVNQFLVTDRGGTSTIQIAAQLQAVQADDLAKAVAQMQSIIASSPLTAEVKASVTADSTGLLFGDQLLALGFDGDGSKLIDFILNLETVGIPLSDIQAIFKAADPTVVHDFIVNAINKGVPLDEISKAVAAIPPEIRTGLVIQPPVDSSGNPVNLPTDSTDFKINAVLKGAEDFADLKGDVDEPGAGDFPVTTVVNDDEYQALIASIAEGQNIQILATVEPNAYNAMIKQIKDGLAALGIVPNAGALEPQRGGGIGQREFIATAAGNIFGGGGFRAFRAGGMANGMGLRREAMFGKVKSNMRGILWAEPQTHKEAYIPYNPARRVRAMALVSRVARDFGMDVGQHRVAVARHGATLDGQHVASSGDGKEIARLAGQVATLARVIEERETQPLIGELKLESKTTNPRATARYVASDILKALR